MNPVIEYMEALVSFKESGKMKVPEGWKYSCIEDLVLKNGRNFTEKIPFWDDLLPKKGCFENVTKIVIKNKDLIYVEGFAQPKGLITTLHAWCLTKDEKVIDPTWENGEFYYGIPFNTEYVLKVILERKKYGILDNWEMDFPLLKKGIKKCFLAKNFKNLCDVENK